MAFQPLRPTFLLGAVLAVAALGCNQPRTVSHRSGLMAYLYPKQAAAPQPNPAGARLKLPLKLGVAFVPGVQASWRAGNLMGPGTEKPLLDIVKASFKDKPWVQEIRLIPSSYLMPQGGFDNLDQVARMYGVDVMALVSVDQIQYTDPKWYSFAYLSILGAYVLPGDQNDTRTLIDAAVFDMSTRNFLLRAPGQSVVKGSSTWVNRELKLREHSAQGLEKAMQELAVNLDAEVAAFKAEVAAGGRNDVDVIDRQGRSLRQTGGQQWGGAFAAGELLLAFALCGLAGRSRKRR